MQKQLDGGDTEQGLLRSDMRLAWQVQTHKERLLEDVRQGHEDLERVQFAIQNAQELLSAHEASSQAKAAEVEGLSRQAYFNTLPSLTTLQPLIAELKT